MHITTGFGSTETTSNGIWMRMDVLGMKTEFSLARGYLPEKRIEERGLEGVEWWLTWRSICMRRGWLLWILCVEARSNPDARKGRTSPIQLLQLLDPCRLSPIVQLFSLFPKPRNRQSWGGQLTNHRDSSTYCNRKRSRQKHRTVLKWTLLGLRDRKSPVGWIFCCFPFSMNFPLTQTVKEVRWRKIEKRRETRLTEWRVLFEEAFRRVRSTAEDASTFALSDIWSRHDSTQNRPNSAIAL